MKAASKKQGAKAAKVAKGGAQKRRSTPGTFTPEKKERFLELYATGMTVRECSLEIGISEVTIFKHRRTDESFGKAFDEAMETNTDVLEDHLNVLARAGNVAAIFGTLKARRPDRWRDRAQVDHTSSDGSFKAFAVGMVDASKDLDKHAHGAARTH